MKYDYRNLGEIFNEEYIEYDSEMFHVELDLLIKQYINDIIRDNFRNKEEIKNVGIIINRILKLAEGRIWYS